MQKALDSSTSFFASTHGLAMLFPDVKAKSVATIKA